MSVESINSAAVTVQPTTQRVDVASTEKTTKQPSENTPSAGSESVAVEKENVQSAVTKLNDFMQNSPQRNLSFSVDESTKEMVVVVTDKLTNEVIRQMPTEEALAVAKQIESMLGLILNDKA